jgi:hypothetical protein
MSNVMLSLVSDQRTQNIMPILQDGADYDELIVVLSKDRRTGKPLPRYEESANDLMAVLRSRLAVKLGAELDSFRRRLGGPYAQAYYARASEAYANRIRKQCEKFRLDGVFFGADIRDIGREIVKYMGGRP